MTHCPRCGAALPEERLTECPLCLLTGELSPAMLGDSLELLEELGKGGMGTVWKARHLRLGRTVAVKFVAEPLASSPDFRKRFEREARALAMLSHPNIVGIHDFGEDDGRAYIVMEYVAGRPLSESIPMASDAAVDVALQVCDALICAHGRGIVHRDIKPANVLLDGSGRVKVGDFGIARLLHPEHSGLTATDPRGVVGTPAYMAPEALRGAAPDPRMDLYSLGVMLYEMVTGRLPAGSFPALSPPLDRVVRRALAPDPESRYVSAEEMRADLAALERQPSGADLDPAETNWLRATALSLSLATAVALWALLLSLTPRVLRPGDVVPLVMIGGDQLADGRIVSWARFETAAILAAVGFLAIATVAYGALRRHWRQAGLETHEPDRPVRESRLVLACGLVSIALYALRRAMEALGFSLFSRYVPILGGVTETLTLFFVWVAVLQARRRSRPLQREGTMWAGLALALAPPAIEMVRYLAAWRP